MTISLGVDTGGTYSDAVLLENGETVLATAKSLTTPEDLSIGIGRAVSAVLRHCEVNPAEISMVSLSTTLATNALVEGYGERVALVLIGFESSNLAEHGLPDALQGGPCIALKGGHDHSGTEAHPLDIEQLTEFVQTTSGVTAFAIASLFATRNPTHENRAARLIADMTGLPVTCSHHLSANLNGPKRALTALLNARLVGLIDRLITSAEARMAALGITAPTMVVRGDGALISSQTARERPIETILSGPAASLVGAQWLSKTDTALVSDIGGTTTDIGVLQDGKPTLDPDGAEVGGFRTMVEAVAMRTRGLGGDSQVTLLKEGLSGGLALGPQRVLPVSLLAIQAPDDVIPVLQKQVRNPLPSPYDAQFVRALARPSVADLPKREAALLERIGDRVRPLSEVLLTRIDISVLQKLRAQNLVQLSGVTPSDAAHVLRLTSIWHREAAAMALRLMGRQKTGAGTAFASDPVDLARRITAQLTERTTLALLETAFEIDQKDFDEPAEQLAGHTLTRRAFQGHRGAVQMNASLSLPVIGLGASAPTYYPEVGKALSTKLILPEHAAVANAIGAVVGQIRFRVGATVTSPAEGKFRVHTEEGPVDYDDLTTALSKLSDTLRQDATRQAQRSGAIGLVLSETTDIKRASIEGSDVFIEATLTVEAAGRPRFANNSNAASETAL